ncbi:Pentatricopeptide repeat-containing protein -mitochondrial [Striga hermonthica]|uniref:Pentatricopeptide repeat-containing protein -mitochondrial n=1 Tax=Striga hermonthica TaxID=68872 RepID=A0A9N7R0T4_STRHE|nr:Pentatricopeptide repeat-containing protein -mitochondrial [Striga hermonthica]
MRSQLVQITSKITALAKLGSISQARNLFDQMAERDTIAWNAIISGYSHSGLHHESLSLFNHMRFSNVKPDHFTYTAVLSACAGLRDSKSGQRFHALVIVSGWKSSLPVNNSLIDMYGKFLRAWDAQKVFENMGFLRNVVSWCSLLFAYVNAGLLDLSCHVLFDMPGRAVVAWNTVIAGCSKWARPELCLVLFRRMLEEDYCGSDQWTLSAVMNSCSEMCEPCYGYMVHGFIIQTGWENAVEVSNSVLSFYIKFGEEDEILKAVEAVRTFSEVSLNVIIDAYMKIGNLEEACRVFQSLPNKRNLISWTSMIAGCVRNGHEEQALNFFIDLTRSYIRPDDVTLGAVLHACSNLAALSRGRAVQGHVIKSGFHAYCYVGNSLVNMYARCGDILDAHRAFEEVPFKDLISWNTMLFAFGLHGQPVRAMRVLEEISASGLRPDKVTFIGLLMTCSHSGLIDKGLPLFESMSLKYGLRPDTDHIACVVDMLVRGGKFEKAEEFVNKHVCLDQIAKMGLLEVLVGSYLGQGDLKSGAKLAEKLCALRPRDEMGYVVLSNMYCASGEWVRAQGLRKEMADRGVRKMYGCSWVEVRNRVTAFVAGSDSFSCMEEVYGVLSLIQTETRQPMSVFGWDGIT